MNQNIVFSIMTIIFSSFFLIFSLQLPASKSTEQIGPGGWPNFILSLMLILGIILLIRSIVENKKKKSDLTNGNELTDENVQETKPKQLEFITRHWFVVALIVFYFIMMPLLGFFVSTFIFILLITWLLGMKRWIYILITALVSSLTFTFIFATLITLPLPRGVSIFHELSILFQQ